MIDIVVSNFKKSLVTSESQFRTFVGEVIASGDTCMGMDTETNGWDFTIDSMAGFSMSSHAINRAIYVPVNHDSHQVDMNLLVQPLQMLLDTCQIIFHGSTYDMLFLAKYGVEFKKTRCTYILANMMQARNGGLKDLVLEYGLVNFKDVILYRDLIQEAFNLGDTIIKKLQKKDDDEMKQKYSFGKIDPTKFPKAVDYACNDAVWSEALYGYMEEDIKQRIDGLNPETVNPFA